MITPSQQYEVDCASGRVEWNAEQAACLVQLDIIFHALCQQKSASWLHWFRKKQPVTGMYLYGDVGRGKTYLMDLLYQQLPDGRKNRMHFHRFMYHVHHALKQLQMTKTRNPLDMVAKNFAVCSDILCFDEFFVSDVTDAMIMAGLFKALLGRGITLVATSNIPPNKLYENGVHRDRFLPVIDLIEQHTQVYALDSKQDYRLRALENADVFYTPDDSRAENNLQGLMYRLSIGQIEVATEIMILGRPLPTRSVTDGVLWCDFSALCRQARGTDDYMEIAKLYHSVLISHVPQLSQDLEDAARRFIALVDEFYDRRVKLMMSLSVSLDVLYTGRALQFEFQRTQSRLIEMQSSAYLALAHRP